MSRQGPQTRSVKPFASRKAPKAFEAPKTPKVPKAFKASKTRKAPQTLWPSPAMNSGGGSGRGNGGRGGRSGGGGLDKSNGGGLGSKRASLTTEGKVIGSNRDWKLFICFCVAAVLLMGQLVHLQVFAAPDLSEEAKAHRTREVVIPAKRGTIYDLKGSVLATSVDAVTIYANPEEIADPKATANILASVLGGKTQDYYDKLIEDTTFVYILQKADEEQAEKLKQRDRELKEQLTKEARAEDPYAKVPNTALLGIHYYSDTKRVYPHGSIGTQVIGAVDVDDAGIFGIEKMYDNVLCGTDGKLLTEYSVQTEQRPLSGQPIPGSKREEVAPVDGQDIIISLDIELQQYVETELARVGEERATENGNALVLDGATGEIYAVASLPLAERDNMTVEAIEQGATTLKSICSEYEPGSTFKPITATAILEEGAMGIDEEIFVPAFRAYSDYTIKDSHERPDETMSFRTIIAQSSNVGISLVKDRISNESYADYLKQFGIGQPTHVDFPGESAGMLSSWEDWSSIQTANISFGQGLTVSPLQIASFYGAVANDGTKYRPHFLVNQPHSFSHVEIANKSERIMSPETAQTLTDMLSAVVTEGTGQAAAIEGYTVAGKTGTAQKASPEGGYLPDNYIVSFVGFFAESQSELVCITSMDNPTGAEGNAPTGPLFASIMRFAANSYMIEPEGSSAAESTTE